MKRNETSEHFDNVNTHRIQTKTQMSYSKFHISNVHAKANPYTGTVHVCVEIKFEFDFLVLLCACSPVCPIDSLTRTHMHISHHEFLRPPCVCMCICGARVCDNKFEATSFSFQNCEQ